MKKLRLLSAAALTMFIAAAPAMTSQAAMFTTCVPGSSSGIIINSGMLSESFGQRGGQNFCGDLSCADCLTGGNCQVGGNSCQLGENGCQAGGNNCQLEGNGCQVGGNNCQTGGNSCQGGNSLNTGWQNGIQTLPSFGGMPAVFRQNSCR